LLEQSPRTQGRLIYHFAPAAFGTLQILMRRSIRRFFVMLAAWPLGIILAVAWLFISWPWTSQCPSRQACALEPSSWSTQSSGCASRSGRACGPPAGGGGVMHLSPNETLQPSGVEAHHCESALIIATVRGCPHIGMSPAAELGR
jgi:hypothetical protein